jgi:hypothetical protein
LSIEGIDNIFGIKDFVTMISKTADVEWDMTIPKMEEAFKVDTPERRCSDEYSKKS